MINEAIMIEIVIDTIIARNTNNRRGIKKERSIKDNAQDQAKGRNRANTTLLNTRIQKDNRHDSQKS